MDTNIHKDIHACLITSLITQQSILGSIQSTEMHAIDGGSSDLSSRAVDLELVNRSWTVEKQGVGVRDSDSNSSIFLLTLRDPF